MHEKGLADHELIGRDERDDFAGTSAVEGTDRGERERTGAYEEGRAAAHDPRRAEDFGEGRREEER